MGENEVIELTRRQRLAGNVTAGTLTVLCGLFLLLCGTHAIDVPLMKILTAALLFTVGGVFLITGFIQKNTVSIWIAFAFLIPAFVEVLVKFADFGYSELYPFYIAIPSVASIVSMTYSREWRAHIPPIVLFGVVALIFMLNSLMSVAWGIVLPLLVVFIGVCILLYAFKLSRSND